MASRIPCTHVIDYCFHPIHVVDENKDLFVPCGKCDGCLLHRANEWSMRVGMECEATPFSIFCTLTYDNKYLPKLKVIKRVDDLSSSKYKASSYYVLTSDNDLNIRFNGVEDVRRKEEFATKFFTCDVDDFKTIQNFPFKDFTCYSSKRDFQLYLKLLRKDLENVGIIRKNESKCFRYFAVSEYGPTTFRAHIHFILFPKNEQIATYLIEYGLYKNWQMCHKDRFEGYTHFCDSGARGYLTQYLTQFSTIPPLYKDNKELKPFRLSSKSPAIGYVEQKMKKYIRMSQSELLNTLVQFPDWELKLFLTIPRIIVLPYSLNVKDLASCLFLDWCGFMEVYGDLLDSDDMILQKHLYSYLRQVNL